MGTDSDKSRENFIFDIDDTIDNLFQPSRKIEIDPLTQEIKTIDEEGSEVASSQEDAPAIPVGQAEKDEGAASSLSAVYQHIDKIHQQILTIEWEANDSEISKTLNLVSELADYDTIKENASASSLVEMMKQLMGLMAESPETASTKTPSIMQEGVRALSKLFNPDLPGNPQEFEEKFKNLSKEFAKASDESRKSAAMAAESAGGSENILDLELEKPVIESADTAKAEVDVKSELSTSTAADSPTEESDTGDDTVVVEESALSAAETTATPVVEKVAEAGDASDKITKEPVVTTEVKEPLASQESVTPVTGTGSDALFYAVVQHIKELERCIEKIKPVENLLAKTKGMQKLQNFQSGIRKILETEKEKLVAFTRQAVGSKAAVKDEEKTDAPCPWKSIAKVEWGTETVYVPEEEIACARKLSVFKKGKLPKLSEFKLSLYKSMPWSKLKPCMEGKLADVDEKTLNSIKVPIVMPDGSSISTDNVILLLHNGKEGVALPVRGKPEYINTEGLLFSEEADKRWQTGVLYDGKGVKIAVVTVQSLKNS
jgi:hypothetical protein